jgi:hypothetical protein
MQTLIRPQYFLRVRLILSILTGPSLIRLRKLHSESRLQKFVKKIQTNPATKMEGFCLYFVQLSHTQPEVVARRPNGLRYSRDLI